MTESDDHSVRRELTIPTLSKPERLDRLLADHEELDLTRSRIQKLMTAGLVTINGSPVAKNVQVKGGETVRIEVPPVERMSVKAEDIPIEIVYEDEYLAVVNKPAGMVTHPAPGNPSGTLVNALCHRFGHLADTGAVDSRPGIVHRLDKNTSGLIIVARTEAALLSLQKMIQARQVKRIYQAIVCGHLAEETGEIDLPIGRSIKDRKKMTVTHVKSREAVTTYQLLERFRAYDYVEVHLQTGRTHQIRVHFSHLGHPVLGDPEYGGREKWHRGVFAPERLLARKLLIQMPRQALHARRLEFEHPITGEEIKIETELPEDFAGLLELLRTEGV
ncbi:MAG TPA: RluA family pseudouridine synthase [candidate division Zixibacteria bacterium]|nr:RluA family pseudouridine synthase [candidate division Zixibacteria bacterium]